MNDPFDIWHLDTRHVGRRVFVYDCLASTNTHALQLAGERECEGLAILADEQSAGRGQHGRRWLAPPRSSVLLSVLLIPPDGLTRPVLLTAWAAVSVGAIVQQLTGLLPRIKWPNDVLVRERKISGILIEQSRHAGQPATVVGIGLNVTQTEEDFVAAGLPEATSLRACGASLGDSHAVARLLLSQLDATYDRLIQGDRTDLEARWQDYLGFVGEEVVLEFPERRLRGRVVSCGFEGLGVRMPDGEMSHVTPESILHIQRC